MSDRPEQTSTSGEGTWTDTIHQAISSTSVAIHRAVDAVTSYTASKPEDSGHDSAHPIATTRQSSSSDPPDAQPSETAQAATPRLTGTPTHISTADASPPSGGQKTKDGGLPAPQSKEPENATSRGDAYKGDKSPSSQRQVDKGPDVEPAEDSSSRLKASQESGPISMSGEKTSHPGVGATPASPVDAPAGDPGSGQSEGGGGRQESANPMNDPSPKSKEDDEDEGTGQKYVKSTGVAAKGGDFDAAKPGAGVRFQHL